MGKSKKQIAAVVEPTDGGSKKKKGKRGSGIDNGVKLSKKQKVAEEVKEVEEEIEMAEAEEVVKAKPSTKRSKKSGGAKAKVETPISVPAEDDEKAPEEGSEEDGSDEEPAEVSAKQPSKKTESTSEDDSDDSDEEAGPKQSKSAAAAVEKLKTKAPAKKLEGSEEEDGSDDSEEELDAEEEKLMSKSAAIDESESSDGVEEDEKEDEKVKITPAKEEQAAKPKTHTSSADGGASKTVFVKNLAWSVDDESVREFFESAGKVLEVRLATGSDGRFRGFGHIEFDSEEAAQKACEKSGEALAGRDIFVDMARERPASDGSRDFKSPRGGGSSESRGQSGSDSTAFVKGFDKSKGEDTIRSSLTEFFSDCGVQSIRIPTDRDTGDVKGFAYVDFSDKEALSKAIEYNGSDLDGHSLFVEEAGGGSSRGGGGRGRGGGGGGFGGRGGRGRGGFGKGGGRGGGRRGGRGFGGSREKAGHFGAGKKTTFGDD